MASYKELKDIFLEEVAKIDVSKLSLSLVGGLKDYAELLKAISNLPDDTYENQLKNSAIGFGITEIPKINESEVK